jgi:hypothetical protein
MELDSIKKALSKAASGDLPEISNNPDDSVNLKYADGKSYAARVSADVEALRALGLVSSDSVDHAYGNDAVPTHKGAVVRCVFGAPPASSASKKS